MARRSDIFLVLSLCCAALISSPVIGQPAAVASQDIRSNMIWVDGRTVSWTMPDAEGRKPKATEANRQCAGFYVDRTEVTNRQFVQFLSAADSHAVFYDPRMDIMDLGKHRYQPKEGTEEFPVAWVDWMGAFRFAAWSGKRLPTEDEWMIAALSGRELRGNGDIVVASDSVTGDAFCNGLKTGGYPGRVAVASYPRGATPNGICDLAGNVAEWTTSEVKSPLSAGGAASWMVVKGGSYLDSPSSMTALSRTLHQRNERLSSLGFRCILRAPHTP